MPNAALQDKATGGQPPPVAIEAPLPRLATNAWLPSLSPEQWQRVCVLRSGALSEGTDSEERARTLGPECSPYKATQDPICLNSCDGQTCGRLQEQP